MGTESDKSPGVPFWPVGVLLLSWLAFLTILGCQSWLHTRDLARREYQIKQYEQKIDELNRQLPQAKQSDERQGK